MIVLKQHCPLPKCFTGTITFDLMYGVLEFGASHADVFYFVLRISFHREIYTILMFFYTCIWYIIRLMQTPKSTRVFMIPAFPIHD